MWNLDLQKEQVENPYYEGVQNKSYMQNAGMKIQVRLLTEVSSCKWHSDCKPRLKHLVPSSVIFQVCLYIHSLSLDQ